MGEFELIIEMEGHDQIIEIQYDKSSGYVFNTIYGEDGMPLRREVKRAKHNPIPMIRDELTRQIQLFKPPVE